MSQILSVHFTFVNSSYLKVESHVCSSIIPTVSSASVWLLQSPSFREVLELFLEYLGLGVHVGLSCSLNTWVYVQFWLRILTIKGKLTSLYKLFHGSEKDLWEDYFGNDYFTNHIVSVILGYSHSSCNNLWQKSGFTDYKNTCWEVIAKR